MRRLVIYAVIVVIMLGHASIASAKGHENGADMFVSVREVFENLGATIKWNGKTETISILFNQDAIQLQINSKKAMKNGEILDLQYAPVIDGGETILPVSVIGAISDVGISPLIGEKGVLLKDGNQELLIKVKKDELADPILDLGIPVIYTKNYHSPIMLKFVGDVMMDWSVKKTMEQKGVDYPFIHIKDDLTAADFAMLNLETAVTQSDDAVEKMYNFKSNANHVKGLIHAGFDLASLANNHTMDYGEKGLLDTLETLDKLQLPYIGAGKNAEEAYRSHRVEINGKTLSFLAFSRVLPSVTWYARENKPGIASGYQLDRMISIVEEEAAQSDYVIVNIHWGKERANKPLHYQKEYARKLIDAGADAIVGHHPHVMQGFEYYKGKPIAYSLGNFLFPNYVKGRTAETGILTLHIKSDEIDMFFNPYYIENDQIVPLPMEKEVEMLNYLESVSFGGLEVTKATK